MVEARHAEEFLLFAFEKLQKLAEVSNEYANVVLIQCGERQDRAELDEQSQQVECTVDLRHWLVWIFLENVSVLRSFDFVE